MGNKNQPDYQKITLFGCLIILVNVGLLYLGWWKDAQALAIAGVGITTFFGTLSLADYATMKLGYEKGEMRTALTASIIVTYLVIMAHITFSKVPDPELAKSMTENLRTVVSVVVGFYFGVKGVEKGIAIYRGKTIQERKPTVSEG
jgi:hypothetical protein